MPNSFREHWEMRFHAGLQTTCHLKRGRLSDLSAQKLQIYFPLRQMDELFATQGKHLSQKENPARLVLGQIPQLR